MRDRIGTCGWAYPHWRGIAYGDDLRPSQWLSAYAALFDSVEIDATYYRLPSVSVTARWAAEVPDGFRFAAKASRYLTHMKKLHDPGPAVDLLAERLAPLPLDFVVLALPPTMRAQIGRLDETLRLFARAGLRCVVEPRHESWFTADLRRVLERYAAPLVLTDREPATRSWATCDEGYVRIHEGIAGLDVDEWAEGIAMAWPSACVMFNNDIGGVAVAEAAVAREAMARARAASEGHRAAGNNSGPGTSGDIPGPRRRRIRDLNP